MTLQTEKLREDWDKRQRKLGLSKRAVLFKRLPGWVNERIHGRHVKFVLDNCPEGARKVLDVGCGYGRISKEIDRRIPGLKFQGVDLCEEFAKAYQENIGACHVGSIQEFHSEDRFDVIVIVTTMMYLKDNERRDVINKLWRMLEKGGCLICIEPATEMFDLWRRVSGKADASPTGGDVSHFSRAKLIGEFAHLEGATIRDTDTVTLVPLLSATALHHAVAMEKG